ncbi:hypothetical protein BH23ACT11_BH23ACT11_00190 [soil metagenome]
MQQQPAHHDVAEEIYHLALEHAREGRPYRDALATIRQYVAKLLDEGCSREELYAELNRARDLLEARNAPEEAEDPVLDVMDFLVGWCSPGARL